MEREPVEMVRVPREEEVYAVEDVLGRDARSVFPTEAKQSTVAERLIDVLGESRRFISESELQQLRGADGRDSGQDAIDQRPLAVILKEAKEAKEAKFQEMWKQMKTGKNRPLDEEELEFLDNIQKAERERELAWSEQERAELEAFREAARAAAETEAAAASASASTAGPPGVREPVVTARPAAAKPVVKPIVRAVVRGHLGKAQSRDHTGGAGELAAVKRQKTTAQPEAEPQPAATGLGDLLGGYDTDDED